MQTLNQSAIRSSANAGVFVARQVLGVASLGLFSLLVAPVQASSFVYDGIELSYSKSSVSNQGPLEDFDFGTVSIEGMYSFNANVVVGGTFISGSGDTRGRLQNGSIIGIDVEATGPSAFGFYHAELKPGTDYYVGGLFSMQEVEFSSGGQDLDQLSDDDTAKSVIAGLRHQFSPQLELGARLGYDLDADDDELSYEINARYAISQDLDVAASFSPDDNGDTISVAIKKYLNF